MRRFFLISAIVAICCGIPAIVTAAVSIDPPEVPNPYKTSEGRAIRDVLLEVYKIACSGNESIETLRALYRKTWNEDQAVRLREQREVDPRYTAALKANEQDIAAALQASEQKRNADNLIDELKSIGGSPDGDHSPAHLRQLIADHMADVTQAKKEQLATDRVAARKMFEDSVHVEFSAPPPGYVPWNALLYAVNTRLASAVFKSTYAHGQPWAPTAEHVLDSLSAHFSGMPGAPTFQAILQDSLPLYGHGCDDPMVLYACAVGLQESGKDELALDMLVRARKQFLIFPYPDLKIWACLGRLIELSVRREDNNPLPETQALIREWVDLGVKILREEKTADPAELQLAAYWLGGGIYANKPHEELLHTAFRAEIEKGTVDPWLAADVTGHIEIIQAWISRGGGWSNTVTEAGWQGFRHHLERAETAFTSAWKLNPALADPCACMITVCMGKDSGFDEEKLWFNRAIAAQPDYEAAFLNLYEAWKPRWGGNYQRILEVGLQALRTKTFATGTPEFLLRAFDSISGDLDSLQEQTRPFWETPGVWGNIVILFNGYLAEPSRASIRDWDLTRYAAYAWKCGQRDKVKDIIARIAGSVDGKLFKIISGEDFETVKWGIH